MGIAAFHAHGDVESRFLDNSRPLRECFSLSFQNPSFNQFRADSTLTSVNVGVDGSRQNEWTDYAEGRGEGGFGFRANTYTRYRSSTLWGHASYRHSIRRDVKWNETSDADMIYPYFTADSVGGNMKGENYSFAGGYADRRGRWIWGAFLEYEAGLYYRNVDPRPCNVTGLLTISAGWGYKTAGYALGLSLRYEKYKQSSDIEFKSDLGIEKIYHLTGLGTHYKRFAGTGESSYYNGQIYGGSLNIYPVDGQGIVASVDLCRFEFDKVLVDLNKLPMVFAWHNSLAAQTGWKGSMGRHGYAAVIDFNIYRRHGSENIFGDAASSIYPQIGSIGTYADNSWKAGASAAWEFDMIQPGYFFIEVGGGYAHRSQLHAVARREAVCNNWNGRVRMAYGTTIAKRWTLKTDIGAYMRHPAHGFMSADIAQSYPQGLGDTECLRYKYRTGRQITGSFSAELLFQLNKNYALGLHAQGNAARYVGNVHREEGSLAITFYL